MLKTNDVSTIKDNVQALYEMGKISSPTLNAASKFCQRSNIGEYACQVQTRFGWCCDLCLEDELLTLYAKGVHTINSCCGHGNDALRAILVIGEESCMMMRDMGYEFLQDLGHGTTMWRPKSNTISDVVIAKMDAEVEG